MGCHLANGAVVGDRLRCGLHHRTIGADGSFGGSDALRQPVVPVAEYLGGLWAWIGPGAPLHALDDLALGSFAHCSAGEHHFPLPWQALVANGFDVEHLASVHERRLQGTPALERQGEHAIDLTYRTHPTGRGLADRLTRALAPQGVAGEITSLGGSMMLVRGALGKRRSFILMSFVPSAQGETTIRAIVGVERPDNAWGRIQAQVASALFKAFLHKDLHVLDRLQWHEPEHETSLGDRYTRRLCDWFRELPHG